MSKTITHQQRDHSLADQTRPSKSQRKRDAHALQRLGASLVDLPPSQLARMALAEKLLEAIQQAREIKPGGARKRQIQHIGRLLRESDTEAIRQALPGAAAERARANRQVFRLEHVTKAIMDGGDKTIQDLLQKYSGLERQRLRQLARNIRQSEADSLGEQRAVAALHRYLAESLASAE